MRISLTFCFLSIYLIGVTQDSLNITKKAELDIFPGKEYNDIWGYTDSNGNEFAIVGSENAINIVNVTDCANPILDSSYVDGSSVVWRDFKTYQNYVYGICDGSACNNEGLEIINMNTGEFKQSNAEFNKAHNIYIEEQYGRLYVVGVNGATDLIIYDIATDPWNPIELVSHDFGTGVANYIHDIYVKDNIAYASHGYPGFAIYDVSNPSNITLLNDYTNTTAYNHSSWLSDGGNYSYVAFEVPTGIPIDIYEIDASYNIIKKGDFTSPLIPGAPTNNRPHNPFVKGDSLYISYYHDGIQVWNIDEKEMPVLTGYYDTEPTNTNYNGFTGSWGIYPYFDSGCIVASDINNGLFTFEMIPPPPPPPLPDPEIIIDSTMLVIDNPSDGLIFKDTSGNLKIIEVGNFGNISTSTYNGTGSPHTLKDTDLLLQSEESGIIFKTSLGFGFRLHVDSLNNLYTSRVPIPDKKIISQESLLFDDFERGMIMTTDDLRQVKIKLNENGNLTVIDL